MLKRAIVLGLIAAVAYSYWHGHGAPAPGAAEVAQTADTGATEDAFRNHSSGVMVTAEGSVDRVLSDDAQGSRHQRFILRLASGQSILVAHNIDLAGRVPIAVGSRLKLHGEYEWNDRGGVVHWTHRDPAHKHEAGWIETGGRRYE